MKAYVSSTRQIPEVANVPRHVAMIMDGNGRWAKKKSLSRSEGHKRGAEIIEPLMDAAIGLGIKAVSLYAFSTENWRRPRPEVLELFVDKAAFAGTLVEHAVPCVLGSLVARHVLLVSHG